MPSNTLDKSALEALVDLLAPHCSTAKERQALFTLAFGVHHPLRHQWNYDGEIEVFVVNAISRLHEFGELEPGKTALWAVLEVIYKRSDANLQQRIQALKPLINPSTATPPIISSPLLGKFPSPSPIASRVDIVKSYCTYKNFVGRNREINSIIDMLRNPKGERIIAIYGLGGMGKTALANEAAQIISGDTNAFEFIVWLTGTNEVFAKDTIISLDNIDITLDAAIGEIAIQTGQEQLWAEGSITKKLALLEDFLKRHSVLIILDGLEALPSRDELIDTFYPLLGKSRLLLTSREHVKSFGIYNIILKKMGEDESISYLKSESTRLSSLTTQIIHSASDLKLKELYELTGGMPLNMRWVVGQVDEASLDDIVTYLQYASQYLRKTTVRNPHYQVYRYIFYRSWQQLSVNSQKLLVCMNQFQPDEGDSIAMIRESILELNEPGFDSIAFSEATRQLINKSLVDKTIRNGHERLSLHTLTHQLVKGDIIKPGKLWI